MSDVAVACRLRMLARRNGVYPAKGARTRNFMFRSPHPDNKASASPFDLLTLRRVLMRVSPVRVSAKSARASP